jgi:hypothetical protein
VNFKTSYLPSLLLLSAALTHPLLAQTSTPAEVAELVTPAITMASSSSSSVTLNTASSAMTTEPVAAPTSTKGSKAFSAIGVDVKLGSTGIGFDIATPLARKFNLRVGGNFFKYNTSITENFVTYGGDIQLATAGINLDWFPFGGGFRVSGGLTGYNGNELTGSATLNPNQSFTINDVTYYTSATNPLHASATLHLGKKVGPTFGIGWGNIVPRKVNKHFSFPVELGFVYVGYPTVDLSFVGSTCDAHGAACQDVANNPNFQQDLAAQKSKYQNQIDALRFYPIATIGFGYKF